MNEMRRLRSVVTLLTDALNDKQLATCVVIDGIGLSFAIDPYPIKFPQPGGVTVCVCIQFSRQLPVPIAQFGNFHKDLRDIINSCGDPFHNYADTDKIYGLSIYDDEMCWLIRCTVYGGNVFYYLEYSPGQTNLPGMLSGYITHESVIMLLRHIKADKKLKAYST